MTPATACRLAGPNARTVARPRGVVHVYCGPLTPSGQLVPRGRRTVCRTHTGRLHVVGNSDASGRRMCLRCSACLVPRSGQAEPTSRDGWRAQYAGVTREQLAAEVPTAVDVDTLDQAAHLSLLLFGHAGCSEPIPHPLSDAFRPISLHDLIGARRAQLADGPSRLAQHINESRDIADARRRADRTELYELGEERKRQLGMPLAKPVPTPIRRTNPSEGART